MAENQFENIVELNSLSMNSFSFDTYTTSYLSRGQLKEYIKYPMIYSRILREISLQAYNANGQYSNVVDYLTSIPMLSHIVISPKLSTKKQKKQKEKFSLMLELLDHKKTSRDILRSLLIKGMYVGILRDTTEKNVKPEFPQDADFVFRRLEGLTLDDNFQIEPLDVDYCRIRGLVNNVYVVDFDMQYFDQFKGNGLMAEIKNFPKDFQQGYLSYKKDVSKRWYTLDYRKTIALKSKSSIDEPYGRPYGLSAFLDIKMSEDYDDSQYSIIEELASSIYYMVLPEGEKQGSCSLNKDQQQNQIRAFEGSVKANINGHGAKISTLTLAPNSKIDRLSKDSSLLKDTLSDENMKKVSTALGFASSALNASSEGGASYSTLNVNIDLVSSQLFEMIDNISKEYTRVLNNHLGLQPKDYFRFKYTHVSWLNKDSEYEKAKDIYTLAGGSLKQLIACSGFDVDDYLALMDEERELGFEEKYPPHITSYTASDNADNSNGSGNLGGRPQSKDTDLKESGQITRTLGSNNQVKPSTK